MLLTACHAATLAYYAWLLRFVTDLRPEDLGDPSVLQQFSDFRPKYLSVWALSSQAVLLSLCLAWDAARLLDKHGSIAEVVGSIKSLVFVGVAAPLALTGSVMYAGLCVVDRDLVMPPALDAALPPWLNQAMHSVPSAQVLLQLWAEPLNVPPRTQACSLALATSIAYIVTMFGEYLSTGRWLYPVLVALGWPGRVALSVFTTALLLGQVLALRGIIASSTRGKQRADK